MTCCSFFRSVSELCLIQPKQRRLQRLSGVFSIPAVVVSSACAWQASTPASVPIPFILADDAGIRPIVDIRVNGVALKAVVHANAGSYLQLNHKQAHDVGIVEMKHVGEYGISKPGSVATEGREKGKAKTLDVGRVEDTDVAVDVFEKYSPDGQDVPMLGLKWISAHRPIMDFSARKIELDPSASDMQKTNASLMGDGYSRHKLYVDPKDGRYMVSFRLGDKTAMFVLGTVARTTLDQGFAVSASVKRGEEKGSFAGPSGATGETDESAFPISLRCDEFAAAPQRFLIEDTYSYTNDKRPTEPGLARGGELGSDFLISNHAVINFGSGVLYLK